MESDQLRYCPDLYHYNRRKTREVRVGNVGIGGDNPIRVQSMLTSDTRDAEACVKEALELAEAGCEIVRVTAQTRKIAENLEHIVAGIRAAGCDVPTVADIHFKPDAAMEAAKWVEKVRVNPGNFVDKKKFQVREYSDDQYAEELGRIEEEFIPLVELCKERGVAMRIGTNHGSLSDRIMNRYGDTPKGMVESALEFARIAREHDYHNFLFSMKASNPKVMIEAYRLLVAELYAQGDDWNYPIHLGVTEAGDGEDGRIKSAIGIGSLLADGVGDTIRVSLTEDAVHEIPVAQALAAQFDGRADEGAGAGLAPSYDPFSYERRATEVIEIDGHELGGDRTVRVFTSQKKWDQVAHKIDKMGDFKPEIIAETSGMAVIDPGDDAAIAELNARPEAVPVTVADGLEIEVVPAFRLLASKLEKRFPIVLKDGPVADASCGRVSPSALPQDASATIRRDSERRKFLDPNLPVEIFTRTYLPHWEQAGATYAVTFRLADSLPQSILDRHRALRDDLAKRLEAARSEGDDQLAERLTCELVELSRELLEPELDKGHGECWLQTDADVAGLVADALEHFDGERYELIAWCLMPNHVHLIVRPLGAHRLHEILQSIKSFTATKANAILGREGRFWQKESYDHLIRDQKDFESQVRYVLENPAKARLKEWVWSGSIYFVADASRGSSPSALPQDASATDFLDSLLTASRNIGSLLCDGIGDAILVQGEEAPGQSLRLAYNILQAAGTRIFKTDYVACPSCGRTLFNLQTTTQKIREATGHLKGVRIAIMGCIVNGPGEMADADFGYVGGAPGKINLYVGKEAVKFNIPAEEAVDRLIDLIDEHGKWVEAPAPVAG